METKKWYTYERTNKKKNAMYSNDDWFFSEHTNSLTHHGVSRGSNGHIMNVHTLREGLEQFVQHATQEMQVLMNAIIEAKVMLQGKLPDEVTNEVTEK